MEIYTLDASRQPLGRVATKAAVLLMGKHRPSFQRHRKEYVRVVVTHTDGIVLTGRKWQQKMYYRHSGYIGNLKALRADQMRQGDSRRIFRLAVWGMLPKNKLRRAMIKNLVLYKGGPTLEKH